MAEHLANCPYCAGGVAMNERTLWGIWYVYCLNTACRATGPTGNSWADAAAKYNVLAEAEHQRRCERNKLEASGNIGNGGGFCPKCGAAMHKIFNTWHCGGCEQYTKPVDEQTSGDTGGPSVSSCSSTVGANGRCEELADKLQECLYDLDRLLEHREPAGECSSRLGHKWRPRYSSRPWAYDSYLGDICVRCGAERKGLVDARS